MECSPTVSFSNPNTCEVWEVTAESLVEAISNGPGLMAMVDWLTWMETMVKGASMIDSKKGRM